MKKCLLYLLILFVAYSTGCKKSSTSQQSSTRPANPTAIPKKMNGNLIWIGTGQSGSSPAVPAFTQFSVTVVNDTTVVVGGATFNYVSFDSSTNAIRYEYKEPYYSSFNHTTLYYNSLDNTMEYSSYNGSSSGSGSLDVSTSSYKPNKLLKDYIPGIIGTKTLIGTVYDTFVMRHPNDSMYSLNAEINFTAVNDSTIAFDKNFLNLDDDTLHYKSTDDAAKTIVFETFHSNDFLFTTLTYNYITGSMIFEQRSREIGWDKYLKLQ